MNDQPQQEENKLTRNQYKKRLRQQANDHQQNLSSGRDKVRQVKLKHAQFLPINENSDRKLRRAIVEYDGTNFNGFQAQDNKHAMRTVQDTIEEGLRRTTGEKIRIRCASRTDKGVHARGQVISFRSHCLADDRTFLYAINSRLPEDVVFRHLVSCNEAESNFDPRANSCGKTYVYRIANGPIRPVIDRRYVWYVKKPLNLSKMQQAAVFLVSPEGKAKDFSAFTPKKSESLENPKCTLTSLTINCLTEQNDTIHTIDPENQLKYFEFIFQGDRFLYKMVRNLVGTLVDVGLGKIEPEILPTILEKKDRTLAGQGAPAQGLTLIQVRYSSIFFRKQQ
jgi:tRNA pseudouridine38-40 synthase